MDIAQTLRDAVVPPHDESFICTAASALHRHDSVNDQIEQWLHQTAGVEAIGSYTHGTSALVFNLTERHPGDFAKVARIAPYNRAEWSLADNRPWTPFSLQPLGREIFQFSGTAKTAVEYDSLVVEIMPKLEGEMISAIPEKIVEGTGLYLYRNKDTGLLPDGTPVLFDADAVNIDLQKSRLMIEPYAWIDPQWRQDHMRKIHENAKRLGGEGIWVVEENGVFMSKQQKLYGGDYLTRPRPRIRVAARMAPERK